MSKKPDYTDILDQLEQIHGWTISDWECNDGSDQSQTLSVELSRRDEFEAVVVGADERQQIMTVKSVVENLEREHETGAPIDEVFELAADKIELSRSAIENELEKLRRAGEIYEPTEGFLRVT